MNDTDTQSKAERGNIPSSHLFEGWWESDLIDEHRRGISDLEWVRLQPVGDPNYMLGDLVEFQVGGFGIITKVSKPQSGWPSSYATSIANGFADHKTTKRAWHYEGDFKRLAGASPLRSASNA